MRIKIDTYSKDPIYKQLIDYIEKLVHDGQMPAGYQLPSMNELAAELKISKETVKKAYGFLVERGIIVPKQGKGFYVAERDHSRLQVLVIFDKFSVYKQIMFNALAAELGPNADITILNHNQSIDLFEYYLDSYLDRYDWYVIAPHFQLDDETQERAVRQIKRIPYRKLIMIDHLQPGMSGQFGAVYQDFENDIYDGLSEGLDAERRGTLQVITLPTSLYGPIIRQSVERFGRDNGIPVVFHTRTPGSIHPGDTFLVLNSQLDAGLVELARKIERQGLVIGKDVRIISYNEYEINELILGGLTTVSTDFREMGRTAAEMILSHRLVQLRNPFHMIRRKTF